MQDLRLIGIHEDGAHLLLAGPDGARFRLPVDDALRGAARRERPRQGQLGIQIDGDVRPRDVQTMIRAGMDAQEVAERTGWTVDKVHKYEGPILAEREHVAGLAQQVRLRPRGSASGRAPTLATRVAVVDSVRMRPVLLRLLGLHGSTSRDETAVPLLRWPARSG